MFGGQAALGDHFETNYKTPDNFDLGVGIVETRQRRLIELFNVIAMTANEYKDNRAKLRLKDSSVWESNLQEAKHALSKLRDEAVMVMKDIIVLGKQPLLPLQDVDMFVASLLKRPLLNVAAEAAAAEAAEAARSRGRRHWPAGVRRHRASTATKDADGSPLRRHRSSTTGTPDAAVAETVGRRRSRDVDSTTESEASSSSARPLIKQKTK